VTPRQDNRKWLARLSQRGFQVSNGSACSALKDGSSTVLAALGASVQEMRQVLRVSGGWNTELTDWMALADAMKEVLNDFDAS
jgi:cysteine desulfurase